MSSIKRKIAALPKAKIIPKHWETMKAAKESTYGGPHYGKPDWKENPLRVVKMPAAIKTFRQFNKSLRSQMFKKMGVQCSFNPRKLITYQPCVSASGLLLFAEDEELANKNKAYVLGTEVGDCIWNGNHRAVAALFAHRRLENVIYLNLVPSRRKK